MHRVTLSLAHRHPFCPRAFLADDVAAPVEAAATSLRAGDLQSVIATATAQSPTPRQGVAGPVTHPALRPRGVQPGNGVTEVRRFLEIDHFAASDQVLLPHGPDRTAS